MKIKRLLVMVFCVAALLTSCGPATTPVNDLTTQENTPVSRQQVTSEATPATTAISATLPSPGETPVLSATFTATVSTLEMVDFPNRDSLKINLYQLATEQLADGPGSFPVQATVGEGENTLHVAAKDLGTVQFPCAFSPSPDKTHYACFTGGGMDGHVWLSVWGQGPQKLLTEHGLFTTTAWSPDGNRLAYGTLDGFDENKTGTLKLYDLVTGEDLVLGRISPSWQAIFTSDNRLIYLFDKALQIWAIPPGKSLKEGPVLERTIALANVPEGALYYEGASLTMALSPSERYLALLRQNFGYETATVGILNLETGEEYPAADLVRNNMNALPTLFAWSPDSDTLAYLTMPNLSEDSVNGNHSQIWLVDAATQQRTLLWVAEREGVAYMQINWLSDQAILANSGPDACCNEVKLIDVKTGKEQSLFHGGAGLYLVDLADGLKMGLMEQLFTQPGSFYTSLISFPLRGDGY